MRPQEKASFLRKLKQTDFASLDTWLNKKILRRDASEIIVYLSVLGYTLIFAYFTILKYSAFSAHAWDLGIFDQSLWTTLHAGKLFFSTVEQFIIPSGVFFGTHFSPILFLVLPFYGLTSSPHALLIFQSLILALGAVPLYFFAKNALNNKAVAVVFSLAYLFYPPLQGVNWFDFHVQAFLPLFFFCAIYFLANENFPRYFLFVFLALTVAENVPITVAFLGLYCFWRFRKRIVSAVKSRKLVDKNLLVPILTIAIAVAWLFLALWVRQANWPFNPKYTLLYKAVDNWSVLGVQDDPNKLPIYLITQLQPNKLIYISTQPLRGSLPFGVMSNAAQALSYDWPIKALYLFLLFGPLLFLSFRSSIGAVSLAWLVPALFSNYMPYYTIGDHFPAYPVAFIFLGAVEGLRKSSLSAGLPSLPKLASRTKALLVVGLVFTLLVSPLSPVMGQMDKRFPYFADYHLPEMTPHDDILQKICDMVPGNASILTQNDIFPHFSNRVNAYVYPLSLMFERSTETDLEKDLENYVEGLFQKSQYVMTDTTTDAGEYSLSADIYYKEGLVYSKNQTVRDFRLVADRDGICLFEKNNLGQT